MLHQGTSEGSDVVSITYYILQRAITFSEAEFWDIIGTKVLRVLCTGDPYYVLYTALLIS